MSIIETYRPDIIAGFRRWRADEQRQLELAIRFGNYARKDADVASLKRSVEQLDQVIESLET